MNPTSSQHPNIGVRLGILTSMEAARIDATATIRGNAAGHGYMVQRGLRPVTDTCDCLRAWL
jgi:hypothetical protein